MAACGSLSSLFENPLPENPTLIESLSSWNQIKPMKPIEVSSFAEIFGELYFQEKKPEPSANLPLPTPPPSISLESIQTPQFNISECDEKKGTVEAEKLPLDSLLGEPKNQYKRNPKRNGGFSSKNSESLQLCTEGLGSESSDDVDDMLESGDDWGNHGKEKAGIGRRSVVGNGINGCLRSCWDVKSSKRGREFPPPISSIGRNGKPWVSFRSYREDGRFVLREIRIPTQEWLHASREDGRLKLQFIHPDEDIAEGEEDEEKEGDEVEQGVGGGEIEEDKIVVSEGQSQH